MISRKTFVVKVSGSVFNSIIDGREKELLGVAKQLIEAAKKLGAQLAVVTGGGRPARTYIDVGRRLGATEFLLDELGIIISRANAQLLKIALNEYACPGIPSNVKEVLEIAGRRDCIIVSGGFHPGQSTNAVAAIIAEALGATLFVNATNVDGVYDKDPAIHPEAKKLEVIRISELEKLLRNVETKAGRYELFDIVALKIIARSTIPTIITSYNNIYKALIGERVGTRIIY